MAKKKNKKKTTRCTEKKKAMQMEMKTLYLPFELINEILLMLPVKSLIRFKCVCKSWFSLISHPNFANSHFQITSASRILSMCETPIFQSIDLEIYGKRTILNHDFLLPPPPCSHYEIKGSCRGFIFLHCNEYIWIWNPSSGIHKQLSLFPFDSKLRGSHEHRLYGFGYDHSRDDYLVVILTYDYIFNLTSHLEFFSLRDNMWNEIGGTPFTYLNIRGDTCGSFINGVIHWLAAKSCHLSVDVIVAFDLIERKLFEMPLPDDFHHHVGRYSLWLWIFGEFLSLCFADYDNHLVEIWVMKEYKQHSSWTKTHVIHDDHYIPFTKPVCGTKSGDIIGEDFDHNRLVRYNNKGQLLKSLQMDLRYSELAMYTESLFSLPDDREQVLEDDTNKTKNEVLNSLHYFLDI